MIIQNLNRLNDILFKAIFGENPEITLNFINSVLLCSNTPTFQSIDFIDRELDPLEEDGKEARLDLLGREKETGARVNLEIQVIKQAYFGKRSLYYWARLYNNLKRGDKYSDLTRAVTINILDFVLFEDENEKANWRSSFGIYDKKTGKQLTEDLEMHFIELPKWHIQKDIQKMNTLECWVSYFDKKTKKEALEAIAMAEPMVKEAVRRENIFTQDEIRRRRYDLIEKGERDRIGQMEYAINKGLTQGRKEGMKEGMKKGRVEIQTLVLRLIKDGKSDEIPAILADESLQEQFLKKYNII